MMIKDSEFCLSSIKRPLRDNNRDNNHSCVRFKTKLKNDNNQFINIWKLLGAFYNPNGITLNW